MLARSIFRLAVDLGYISENPAKGLPNLKETPPSPIALDFEGLARLSRALVDVDLSLRLLVEMMLNGALRISEALRLQHADVDYKHGVVHLRHTKAQVSQTIPLTPALESVFDRAEPLRRDGNPHISPAAHGTGHMTAPRKKWKQLLIDAGIDHAGFHLCRKTWATLAMSIPGMDVLSVSRMLRHKSIRTTEVHYLATPQKRVNKAANDVGLLLSQHLSPLRSQRLSLVPSVSSIAITPALAFIQSRRCA